MLVSFPISICFVSRFQLYERLITRKGATHPTSVQMWEAKFKFDTSIRVFLSTRAKGGCRSSWLLG